MVRLRITGRLEDTPKATGGRIKFKRNDPRTRAAARKGGQETARRKKLAREGPVEQVTRELGDLDTFEDAARWIRLTTIWAAAGKISGATAKTAVSAVRAWIAVKRYEERIRALQSRVKKLEGELRRK